MSNESGKTFFRVILRRKENTVLSKRIIICAGSHENDVINVEREMGLIYFRLLRYKFYSINSV